MQYVARAYDNAMKTLFVHDVTALRPAPSWFVLCINAINNTRHYSRNVAKDYLQLDHGLLQKMYLRSQNQKLEYLNFDDEEVLRIGELLHGLYDSGDYRNALLNKNTTKYFKRGQ